MKLFKLLAVLFTFTLTGQAHALEVGLLGGLNFWGYGFTPPAGGTLTGKTSGQLGLGGFVKAGLNPILDLELDLIYMKKKNTISGASQTNVFETASYMIPVMVRTSFIPGGFVNVGAGAYYEIGTSSGVIVDGASGAYSDAGVKSHDLGLIGSVQLRLPILPLVHFLVDGRYLYGLNEQSNDVASSGNFKNRSYQAFAGISVGI